ncbi:MAG: LacI family DNA-binding transcriptional regulator [Pseudomonadota bacterium]
MQKAASLKDVARLAGVSTATVTRVLHNNGYVGEETRARVTSALKETGYQLNVVAQSLRKQQTRTLGHLLNTITRNPFFAEVALGLEEQALRHGCNVFIYNVQASAERERLGVETFIRRRTDGIVFTSPVDPANVELAAKAGIPVVQVDWLARADRNAVLVDNEVGAVEAMEHLFALGHRRIGFIGADPARFRHSADARPSVAEQRLSAYRKSLAGMGIAADEALVQIRPYYYSLDERDAAEGHAGMRELLALHQRPTAVFATCDILAAGALQAVHDAGLRVPDDISVIGFDDTYAARLSPPLTTVALPMREIGERAADLVFRHMPAPSDAATDADIVTLPSRLAIRASTAAPGSP